MNILRRIKRLFSPYGHIGRREYFIWGAILFAIKYNFDRAVITYLTDSWFQPWRHFFGGYARVSTDEIIQNPLIMIIIFTTAIPIIWLGITLTQKRLRDVGLSQYLFVLLFIPFINVLLFFLLSLVPSVNDSAKDSTFWSRFIPREAKAVITISVVLSTAVGIIMTLIFVYFFRDYSWGLFVGLPFVCGLISSLLHQFHEPKSLGACVSVSIGTLSLISVVLIFLAIEGLICVVMAAPIGIIFTLLGSVVGFAISKSPNTLHRSTHACLMLPIILLPLTGIESIIKPPPPQLSVTTAVEIDASPQIVWDNLIAFSEIPAPEELIFQTGVAYPIRARIEGHGVGAIRYCEFTTGPFIEPITLWDEPKRLAFSVTHNPPPMQEWTPYPKINPPHLDGHFASERGQFLLTELPNGGTRLEGTTWYHNKIWPSAYWQIYSDHIIHQIHYRVLRSIKFNAEEAAMAVDSD